MSEYDLEGYLHNDDVASYLKGVQDVQRDAAESLASIDRSLKDIAMILKKSLNPLDK